nr:hypothetical protein [Tanacetum cinerariifolium]
MAHQQQQRAATFEAQFEALRAGLHACLRHLQGRQGGNGNQGSLLPRSRRLDVPKLAREVPKKYLEEILETEYALKINDREFKKAKLEATTMIRKLAKVKEEYGISKSRDFHDITLRTKVVIKGKRRCPKRFGDQEQVAVQHKVVV